MKCRTGQKVRHLFFYVNNNSETNGVFGNVIMIYKRYIFIIITSVRTILKNSKTYKPFLHFLIFY